MDRVYTMELVRSFQVGEINRRQLPRLDLFVRFEYCVICRQARPCKKTGEDNS